MLLYHDVKMNSFRILSANQYLLVQNLPFPKQTLMRELYLYPTLAVFWNRFLYQKTGFPE